MDQDKKWRFCVVGNIVRSHIGEDGITYYGTKEYTGGTKVYIDGKNWTECMQNIHVIGLNRFKKFELAWVDTKLIENVRFQTVHNPIVLEIIDYLACFEGWNWWERTAQDKREAKAFVQNWTNLFSKINGESAEITDRS